MKLDFTYQNYWCRTLSIIPVIFFLAVMEYVILIIINLKISTSMFVVFSAIFMFSSLQVIFQFTGKYFLQNGNVYIYSNYVEFYFRNKSEKICYSNINEMICEEKTLYGTTFVLFYIEYEKKGKIKKIYIRSEDIEMKENSSVWPIYVKLKMYNKHLR